MAEPVWDTKNPAKKHKHLSSSQKAKAKRRAEKAGRKYPNLVDNMWAARSESSLVSFAHFIAEDGAPAVTDAGLAGIDNPGVSKRAQKTIQQKNADDEKKYVATGLSKIRRALGGS